MQVAQGFGTSPETKTYPLGREKEGGSSPHCRPHQSTKRTPSLYYRNSYETAPRKKTTQEGKNNKVTHTDLQLSLRACAWPWSREGPDASGAQSSRPGLMVGGEASFSSGVTGLAGCQRGLPPQPRPAYVSKLGHSVCTALPSPGKLDRQELRQLEFPFPTSP